MFQSGLFAKSRAVSATAAILMCFHANVAWAGVDAALSGTVTDALGVAVPGVRVQLQNARKEQVKEDTSSPTGGYQMYPIPFGTYTLTVTREGFEPLTTEVQISSGENATFDVNLRPSAVPSQEARSSDEMVVEVKARKRLIQKSSAVSSTTLTQTQISELPQGGESSLPKLITSTTPGAVGGAFGQVFFRGNHASIQYQIDGVQLPDSVSNTFAQAFSPRNIDHMEIITGGIPAEYGQRLAAVVNIVTKSGPETPQGEIELNYGSYNTVSPHLLYGGSNKAGNLRYFLSLNFNRTDRGIDTPNPSSTAHAGQRQGGSDSIHNTATGNSEFARVDWLADNENRLSFVFFRGQSDFEIPNYPASFLPSDPYFQPGYIDAFGNEGEHGAPTYGYIPPNTDDRQSETNWYGQAVWKRTFSQTSFFQLAPYYKYSSIRVTPDPANDLAAATLITGAQPVSFGQDRKVNNLGLKGDYNFRPNDWNLIKAGFQFQASREDGTISIQTSLADPAFTDRIATNGYFESLYLQDDITLLPSLILNAGMRFDATQLYFSDLTPTDYYFQPRVGLNYMVTDTTKLHVFYGKLFQPAGLENLRRTFEVFGDHPHPEPYDIKAEKDDYYEAGITQQIFDSQVAKAVVFYKNGINVLDDAQLLRTSIAQPFNFATGYSYGLELSLKGELTRNWSEYVNYSYLIAKGKGLSGGAWASDHGSSEEQFMDHGQIHTVNGGLTYSTGPFWWTTQGLFGSGLRTGEGNGIELPSHLTFDTTVGYQFKGREWYSNFKVSGDVLNVFDNRYPITIANSFNGSHYAAGRQFFIRLTKDI